MNVSGKEATRALHETPSPSERGARTGAVSQQQPLVEDIKAKLSAES